MKEFLEQFLMVLNSAKGTDILWFRSFDKTIAVENILQLAAELDIEPKIERIDEISYQATFKFFDWNFVGYFVKKE